jgi:hypothetical protein
VKAHRKFKNWSSPESFSKTPDRKNGFFGIVDYFGGKKNLTI